MIERYSEEYSRLHTAIARLPASRWPIICKDCFPLHETVTAANVIDKINQYGHNQRDDGLGSITYYIDDFHFVTVWL